MAWNISNCGSVIPAWTVQPPPPPPATPSMWMENHTKDQASSLTIAQRSTQGNGEQFKLPPFHIPPPQISGATNCFGTYPGFISDGLGASFNNIAPTAYPFNSHVPFSNQLHNDPYLAKRKSHNNYQSSIPYSRGENIFETSHINKFGPRFPSNQKSNSSRGRSQLNHGFSRRQTNLPQNKIFFCESCDRSFPSGEKLNSHKSEHRTCGIDGCEFTAHPGIINKHISTQHLSGLYPRICTDDVSKWIEERKSQYPTKSKINDDNARIGAMKLKKNESAKKKANIDRNHRTHQGHLKRAVPANKFLRQKDKTLNMKYKTVTVKEQDNDSVMKGDSDMSEINSDSGIGNTVFSESGTDESVSLNKNKSLVDLSYGDMTDEETIVISEDRKIEDANEKIQENKKRKRKHKKGSDDNKNIVSDNNGKRRKNDESHSNSPCRYTKRYRKPTLLQKLLSKEIKQERDTILQCIQYIAENNYFGIADNNSK